MSDFVDFLRLREQLKMADVIAFFGLQTTTEDGDHNCANCLACISKNALFITLSKARFYWQSCDTPGR